MTSLLLLMVGYHIGQSQQQVNTTEVVDESAVSMLFHSEQGGQWHWHPDLLERWYQVIYLIFVNDAIDHQRHRGHHYQSLLRVREFVHELVESLLICRLRRTVEKAIRILFEAGEMKKIQESSWFFSATHHQRHLQQRQQLLPAAQNFSSCVRRTSFQKTSRLQDRGQPPSRDILHHE